MSRLTDVEQDGILRDRFGLTRPQVEAAQRLRAFVRDRLGLYLHVGQVAFAGLVLARDVERPSSAEFLTLLLASGNRAGKTAFLAALVIYCCIDKTNRPKPVTSEEAIRWLRSEYHWYHFGIAQEVADLVFNDMVRILMGTHEGQGDRGCPITADGPIARWDSKEYGDYRWIRFAAEVGGAQVHFRTTGEKALGSLGKDMHGVSFDEAGIERNLPFLVKEVFNLRRLGTGGQLIMVSTPSEEIGTDFADFWEWGDPDNGKRLPSWRSLRMSTRDNIGYGIPQDMFDRLIADMDERTIRQNIDGYFLQSRAAYFNGENVDIAFVDDIPERTPPVEGGTYLQGVDPAKSADSAWTIVLHAVMVKGEPDPFLVGVWADQRRGQKSTDTVTNMVLDAHRAYTDEKRRISCYTAIDATGFGGKMFKEQLEKVVPGVTNVEFGGTAQKKKRLLGDLRTIIDSGRLILPKTGIWLQVRKQLLGYKLEDRGIEQDAVMALVCAVHVLRRAAVGGSTSVAFDLYGDHR